MRRRMLIAFGAIALALGAGVGFLVWWSRPGPEIPRIARPYLWEVGGERPSYLFGTLHIGYEVADLPRPVLAAFDRSPIVVTESDLLTERPSEPRPNGGRDRLTAAEWTRLAGMTRIDEATLVA